MPTTVRAASQVVIGTAVDVEPDGRLVVNSGGAVDGDAEGATHRFAVGDIVHLRPA